MSAAGVEQWESPKIPEQPRLQLPLRVPFSVVKAEFKQWQQGELTDVMVVERYGEVWLVLLQLLHSRGLVREVRSQLEPLVIWDVPGLESVHATQPEEMHTVVDEHHGESGSSDVEVRRHL